MFVDPDEQESERSARSRLGRQYGERSQSDKTEVLDCAQFTVGQALCGPQLNDSRKHLECHANTDEIAVAGLKGEMFPEDGAFAIAHPVVVGRPAAKRIRTLDGCRGIAILLVLAEHSAQYGRFKGQMWARLGSFGVDIFFVLSGYIITTRLFKERDESPQGNLSSFYLRRAFRILPLLGAYLITLFLFSRFVDLVDFRPSELMGSLFFFRNYQFSAHPQGIYTAQFWSLSIEEHFYLLWPALLLRFEKRRALWLAAVGAVACGVWRVYDYAHPANPVGRLFPSPWAGLRAIRTDTRIDGLLLGCVLALLLTRAFIRDFVFRNFPKETPLFVGLLLFLHLQWTHSFPTLRTYLLIALLLAAVLVVEEGLAHQWLNSRPLVWLGTISYSVYIWQQLFLLHPRNALPLGKLSAFPFNLVCVLAVASCSFYFIERPAIALGKRCYTRRVSAQLPLEGAASCQPCLGDRDRTALALR